MRSGHLAEPVAWIGNFPDGMGAVVSFGDLVRAERHLMIGLAESFSLSITEESDRVDILNNIMEYLGVGCGHLCLLPTVH